MTESNDPGDEPIPAPNIPARPASSSPPGRLRSDTGASGELTILGRTVRHPVEHVECFPAPQRCTSVRFATDELASMCPVTEQPDLSAVSIDYEPDEWCVESKSLKLYLWSFRDRAIFAEALAVEIAEEIERTARPHRVTVVVTQRPRGGIETTTTCELRRDSR